MDENIFRSQLVSDGYTQIEINIIRPKPINVEHAHDHSIRGLVIDGVFIVWSDNHPDSYHPGEVFAVACGIKHAEQVGPNGARVMVGRKWPPQKV